MNNFILHPRNLKFPELRQSPFCVAISLNFLFLLITLLFCDLKYEVSDDFIMSAIMSGAFGNTPNPHMIFINILIGFILLPMYKLFPYVSWYFVLQIILIFFSSTVVTWLLLKKMSTIIALMLSVLLNLFFVSDMYILVQFTKTAMFAVMAGSVLFIWGVFRSKNLREILLGAILCLFGTLLRFSVIYLAGGFLILILLYEFSILIMRRNFRTALKCDFPRIIFAGSLLIIAAYSLNYVDKQAYSENEKYSHFYMFNGARAQIVDSPEYGYETYAEALNLLGISENDYYLMKHWEFADPEVFSLEKMQLTAETIKKSNCAQVIGKNQLLKRLQAREIPQYPAFLGCIILLLAGIFLNTQKWWLMLLNMGIGLSYFVYFCYCDRCIYRIEFSVLLGVFICGCCFWDIHFKNSIEEYHQAARWCKAIILLCIIWNILLYIPDRTYMDVTSETRKDYIENVFFDSWNYNAQKYRTVVNRGKPQNRLLDEFNENPQNFYFLDFTTTIQTLYYEWSPWRALPEEAFDNYIYMAGITSDFPDINILLEEKSLSNPLRCLVNSNIYIVDNYCVDQKLVYLQEHYFPDAKVELYKSVDGYQIWKFYKR